MKKMKYKPFKEQKFWGDIWAMVLARIMGTTHEEEKVLGRQVNSGIDYSALKREQSCPVIPTHLCSYREEKSVTVLMTGHPYWQFFEFGAFEFKGREITYCWPSSLSGRQIFVTPDEELYQFFRDHMGGIETQRKPISFKRQESADGKLSYILRTELPSGEDIEVYLESKGKPMSTNRAMVPCDNHSDDKGMIAGGIKGKGEFCDPKNSWVRIDGVTYDFVKTLPLPLFPYFIIIGDMNVVFGGVMSYDREAKLLDNSFSITNPSNNSEIKYLIEKNKDEVAYVNTGPLNESRIEARLVGEAEEIYEIRNKMAGQDTLSIKFNPSIPDLRYHFKEPYVGKFFLSAGKDFPGIVIGNVQAKHLGKFIIFDFLPERPKQAKKRAMQMTISFTDKDKYQIKSQIFSG
jgi:hypothetical protein